MDAGADFLTMVAGTAGSNQRLFARSTEVERAESLIVSGQAGLAPI